MLGAAGFIIPEAFNKFGANCGPEAVWFKVYFPHFSFSNSSKYLSDKGESSWYYMRMDSSKAVTALGPKAYKWYQNRISTLMGLHVIVYFESKRLEMDNKYMIGLDLRNENIRSCLIGRKFSVFSIQTFRKQGKHV